MSGSIKDSEFDDTWVPPQDKSQDKYAFIWKPPWRKFNIRVCFPDGRISDQSSTYLVPLAMQFLMTHNLQRLQQMIRDIQSFHVDSILSSEELLEIKLKSHATEKILSEIEIVLANECDDITTRMVRKFPFTSILCEDLFKSSLKEETIDLVCDEANIFIVGHSKMKDFINKTVDEIRSVTVEKNYVLQETWQFAAVMKFQLLDEIAKTFSDLIISLQEGKCSVYFHGKGETVKKAVKELERLLSDLFVAKVECDPLIIKLLSCSDASKKFTEVLKKASNDVVWVVDGGKLSFFSKFQINRDLVRLLLYDNFMSVGFSGMTSTSFVTSKAFTDITKSPKTECIIQEKSASGINVSSTKKVVLELLHQEKMYYEYKDNSKETQVNTTDEEISKLRTTNKEMEKRLLYLESQLRKEMSLKQDSETKLRNAEEKNSRKFESRMKLQEELISERGAVVNKSARLDIHLKEQSGVGIVPDPRIASSMGTSTPNTTRAKGNDNRNAWGADQHIVKFSKPSDESLMITTNEGIKIYVYKGDMRYLNVDCIVNSSNQRMIHSKGISAIISEAAGPKMNEACNMFLKDNSLLVEGQVCFSTAGNLKHYKGILHVCSPVWDTRTSKDGFFNDLSRVIINSLSEANRKKMSSIAIPAVGSGGRGGPRQLCFSTYPNGIIEYSSKFGKTSKLKEIHLVDVNDEVVDFIRTACLLSITHPDKDKDRKLIKIPDAVKETFVSYIIKDETVDKQFFNMHLSNNVHVVVCDGALFSAYNHRHIQVAACDVSYEFSAVVITEDVEFTGKSRSAQHSLQRGGNDFFKHYEDQKKGKAKKKVGNVYDIFGDKALNYGFVFFAVMPTLSKKALETKSSEQLSFFRMVADCFEKVLSRADKWNIGHLCLPVLGEDFFPTAEEYIMDKFVSDMVDELSGFASKRKTKTPLLIHIAVNTNKKLFRAFTAESDRRTRQKERSSHSPGQLFQYGGFPV